jgi:hypothetical protein
MENVLLLSTAYFPPAEYFWLITRSSKVLIEKWENFHKQTYRNRCVIMGANGPLTLIVPVVRGSIHKTALRDLCIDNTQHWKELHLRSITSACSTAPFFDFYYDIIRNVINKQHKFLLDLNREALLAMNDAIGIISDISYTDEFLPEQYGIADYRYRITPKKQSDIEGYSDVPYIQIFRERFGYIPCLSIIDVLLNNGPGTRALLQGFPIEKTD